ncbi:MAG: hypothetical protein C0408_00055 [Odoribacter sp.]|nr:hypothetical protein [Odoribacter sp.]
MVISIETDFSPAENLCASISYFSVQKTDHPEPSFANRKNILILLIVCKHNLIIAFKLLLKLKKDGRDFTN